MRRGRPILGGLCCLSPCCPRGPCPPMPPGSAVANDAPTAGATATRAQEQSWQQAQAQVVGSGVGVGVDAGLTVVTAVRVETKSSIVNSTGASMHGRVSMPPPKNSIVVDNKRTGLAGGDGTIPQTGTRTHPDGDKKSNHDPRVTLGRGDTAKLRPGSDHLW